MRLIFQSLFQQLLQKQTRLLLLSVLLASCNSLPRSVTPSPNAEDNKTDTGTLDETVRSDESDKPSETPQKDTPTPITPILQPGTYCYQSLDEIEDIQVRLSVDSADRVTGDVQGTIHNKANAYYTSYRQLVDGTIDGSNLNVDVTTWIEYDKQNTQQTWRVNSTALEIEKDTLSLANCDKVNAVFQNENGLEAKDLTAAADNVRTQTVYFSAGESGTTLSNAVVRGDRDVYLLTAQGGQVMTLNITALEDNAVFDVVDPSGMILATEQTELDLLLPHTGEYQIIVGGTRGNASYDLAIAID